MPDIGRGLYIPVPLEANVSDPSRTIVDVLDEPLVGGGMQHITVVVSEYFASEHRNDTALIEYGDRLGNRSVFKRLGYLLELQEISAPDLLVTCRERRSSGLTALDPSVDTKGRILKRWGLRVNVDVSNVEVWS